MAEPRTAPAPPGTLTFLFTDIEGSTRLLRAAGAAYADVLEDHRRLIRTAVRAHGGHEVDTQGDSFFMAFPSAAQAVAAAADAQRALARHPWPDGVRVRVRMGVHTGEATAAGTGYIGLSVHAAARIAAAAHGGQVLVSGTTAATIGGEPVVGGSLRDLGDHRLKDFPDPVRLHQLDVPGLAQDFPPLRTVVQGYRLPSPAGSLVGRDQDVAALVGLLADEGTRLLTLTGPGGIGKTRLALAAARAAVAGFPGGVVLVPLADVVDPSLVLPAVADAVGARREAGGDVVAAVAAAIGDHRTLLVLDNVEQVADAAADLAAVLDRVPAAVLLVTSRQLLRLRSERQFPVAPLATAAAVQLFVERASAVRPGFELAPEDTAAVEEICTRLDGLPLAIELAAARVRMLAPTALLARLRERLDVLGSGPVDVPERQRTLAATMDWSHDLLAPHEQALLTRLGVFAGGAALEAVEAVCGRAGEPPVLDTLAGLVDASLLVPAGTGAVPRFEMLRTVHSYARELLSRSPDRAETERRHTAWVRSMADELRRARAGAEHRDRAERFDADRPELRAAVHRALADGDAGTVAVLARDAFVDLGQRDAEAEVVDWLDQALARGDAVPPETRGRLLVVRALAATVYADFARARSMHDEAAALLPDDDEHAYDAALLAATAAYVAVAEDPGTALPLVTAAADRLAAVGERLGQVYMEVTAGAIALYRSDGAAAQRCFRDGARLAESLGDDAMRGRALSLLGLTLLRSGDPAAAHRHVVDGARINRRGGQPTGMAYSLDGLAALALAAGRPETAARALAAARAARDRAGNPPSLAFLPLLDDVMARTRARLGDDGYAAAAAEGARWSTVEALDRVLGELSTTVPGEQVDTRPPGAALSPP